MTGVRNQGHRIAGEAKDYFKHHERGVEADTYRKSCSETRRSMDVSAGPVNVVDVIVVGMILMVLMRMRMGHEVSNGWACFGGLSETTYSQSNVNTITEVSLHRKVLISKILLAGKTSTQVTAACAFRLSAQRQ